MFREKDETYDDLCEKSVIGWLDEMSHHQDIEVRGGTRATIEYIKTLERKITGLERKNALTTDYLKKIKLGKDGAKG